MNITTQLAEALRDAFAEVNHYAPYGAVLGGPFADKTRAKIAAALAAYDAEQVVKPVGSLHPSCSTFCAAGEPCSITADGVCDVEKTAAFAPLPNAAWREAIETHFLNVKLSTLFVDELCATARRIAAASQQTPVVYQCTNCGRKTDDPVADYTALRAAGKISCCPDRKMVIAQSPDLLAALQSILYFIEEGGNGFEAACARVARAAITKATVKK